MDLLTVLEHEVGHLLDFDHAESGVMQETPPPGEREVPVWNFGAGPSWADVVDLLFAGSNPHRSARMVR